MPRCYAVLLQLKIIIDALKSERDGTSQQLHQRRSMTRLTQSLLLAGLRVTGRLMDMKEGIMKAMTVMATHMVTLAMLLLSQSLRVLRHLSRHHLQGSRPPILWKHTRPCL